MRKVKTLASTKQLVDLITKDQLLKAVPISERTLFRYIKAGKLRAYKLDGMYVFNPADVEDFLKRRAVGIPGAPLLKDVEPEEMKLPDVGRTRSKDQTSYRLMSDEEVQAFFAELPWPTDEDRPGEPDAVNWV